MFPALIRLAVFVGSRSTASMKRAAATCTRPSALAFSPCVISRFASSWSAALPLRVASSLRGTKRLVNRENVLLRPEEAGEGAPKGESIPKGREHRCRSWRRRTRCRTLAHTCNE